MLHPGSQVAEARALLAVSAPTIEVTYSATFLLSKADINRTLLCVPGRMRALRFSICRLLYELADTPAGITARRSFRRWGHSCCCNHCGHVGLHSILHRCLLLCVLWKRVESTFAVCRYWSDIADAASTAQNRRVSF
jgi:hypothetical protein